MLRIPSGWCQAKRSHTPKHNRVIPYGTRHLDLSSWLSPIKSGTKVPLTLAPHPPNLGSVGHGSLVG
jgi:hypothetical protein